MFTFLLASSLSISLPRSVCVCVCARSPSAVSRSTALASWSVSNGENKSHRIEMKYCCIECTSFVIAQDEFFRISFRFLKIRSVPVVVGRPCQWCDCTYLFFLLSVVEVGERTVHTASAKCDRKDASHTNSWARVFAFISFNFVDGFSLEIHLRMWKIVWRQFPMAKNSKSLEINRNRA